MPSGVILFVRVRAWSDGGSCFIKMEEKFVGDEL